MSARAARSRLSALDVLHITLIIAIGAALAACGDHQLPTAIRPNPGQAVYSLDFSSFGTQPMTLMGAASLRSGALALTSSGNQVSAAWFGTKQRLSSTWETTFQFRVEFAGCGTVADGFAFVIQNQSASALASGTGGSDLGYSGFRSALAVEFDVFQSAGYPDPNDNHIAVVGINQGATTISARNTPLASAIPPSMKDGLTHSVRIRSDGGRLQVFYDAGATPLIAVPLNLLNVNGASILDATGSAWVGFTGATGGACAQFKILNWTLVDNKAPAASAGGVVGQNGVATYDAIEAQPITLTASASDPDGDPIAAFEWDFNNDGRVDTTVSTPSVSHAWRACGTFPMSVVAVDALGSRSAPGLAQANVANREPSVEALPQLEAYPGQPMSVSTTFSDVGRDGPWTYHIEWGDGAAGVDGTTDDPSTVITGAHSYPMSTVESYQLKVSVKDKCNGIGVAQATVKMMAIAASVHLDNLTRVFDGQTKAVSVTTDPANIAVQVTYNGSTTVPTNAGSYSVVATITDPRYVGSATAMLTIERAPVEIQLGGLTGQIYDGAAKSATVMTQPNGIPVKLTYDGSATSPVDAGSYAVAADVTDPNYQGKANGTLVVGKAPASLVLEQLEHVYDGTPKSARVATKPAGLAVVAVLYDGVSTAPIGAGSYTLTASLTNRNYDAPSVMGTMIVRKAPQSLVFAPLPPRTYGDAPFALSARGGSSTSPVTFALGSASVGCSLAGATLTITGATPDGESCIVIAHQSGDANYEGAQDVAQGFSIAKATPSIVWSVPTTMWFGTVLGSAHLNAKALDAAGAEIGGSFSYAPAEGTVLLVGSHTLTATFAPSTANYRSASAKAVVKVIYLTNPGHRFIAPVNGRTTSNIGPKINFAFQLFRADGATLVNTARGTMVVQSVSPTGVLGTPIALSSGNAFTYDQRLQAYVFDLASKDLGVGTFRARAILDDGSEIPGEVVLTQGRGRPSDETTTAKPTVPDHGRPKWKGRDDDGDDDKGEPRRPIASAPGGTRRSG